MQQNAKTSYLLDRKLCAIVRKVTSQSLHGKPDESKAYAYLPTVEFTRLDNTIRLCEGVTGVLPCLTRQKLLKAMYWHYAGAGR